MITWAGVWIQRLGLNKQWSNNCFSRRSLGKTLHNVLLAVLCYHTLFDNGDKVTGETHIESVQHRQCQCNTKMLTAVFSQATYFLMLTTFQQLLHIIKSYLRS